MNKQVLYNTSFVLYNVSLYVKEVAGGDGPTENLHLTLQIPSVLWSILAHCLLKKKQKKNFK